MSLCSHLAHSVNACFMKFNEEILIYNHFACIEYLRKFPIKYRGLVSAGKPVLAETIYCRLTRSVCVVVGGGGKTTFVCRFEVILDVFDSSTISTSFSAIRFKVDIVDKSLVWAHTLEILRQTKVYL